MLTTFVDYLYWEIEETHKEPLYKENLTLVAKIVFITLLQQKVTQRHIFNIFREHAVTTKISVGKASRKFSARP